MQQKPISAPGELMLRWTTGAIASRKVLRGWQIYFPASIFLLSLAACSIAPFPKNAEERQASPPVQDERIAHVLSDEGLRKLGEHRYDDASRIFNAGLKFAPTDAQLHFLNGLTYHLIYLRGNEAMKELGIAGYELALRFDPAHFYAALQLGRLQFDAKRYGAAAEAFQHAIDIQPKSGAAYLGLASANYYAQDLGRARAAAEKASSLLHDNIDAARALAMIYAAMGDQTKAEEAAARHAVLEQNAGARARLNARVDQWKSWHEANPAAKRMAGAAPKRPLLAQSFLASGDQDQDPRPGARSGPRDSDDDMRNGDDEQSSGTPVESSVTSNGAEEITRSGSAERPWFDCGDNREDRDQSASGSPGDSNTVATMARLPSPCRGAAPPRMAILDVAFIRTEDNATSSHGINLLQGMAYVFGLSRAITDTLTTGSPSTPDSRTITITRQRSAGFPAAGITYSLNIANSTDNRAEILARPSLIALDRMPSTFFSGRNVTLGIAGQAGSASTITDRPIGIVLSVTPTFIDAETLLLAVLAQRAFIEQIDLNVSFGQSLQTSRNSVSANVVLRMGQTLILSGLSEREIQRVSNGVPVLKDIPVLQYLFNQTTQMDFTRSVLVLITPRPPETDQEVMSRTIGHIDTLRDPSKRKFRPMIENAMKARPERIPGNLEGTYGHVFGNTLYLQFRTGDLTVEHWSEPPRLEQFFRQLREVLYF